MVSDAENYTDERTQRPKSMERYTMFIDQKIPRRKDIGTPPADQQVY
jgi:hypothetical protein